MHDEDLREAFADWLRPVREASPPGMPVIRRRLRRRRARNAAAGATALAAAAGLAVTVHLTTSVPHTTAGPQRAPATAASQVAAATTRPSPIQGGYQVSASYAVSSPVRTLIVRGRLGAISIAGGQRATVSVTEQMQYSAEPPVMTRDLTGGTLKLSYSCPDEPMCAASYDIQVPRGIAVQVSDGNGTIRLSSLAGPVTATAVLGAITATGLTSASADFTCQTGEISAAFSAAPANVRAAATLGAITIRVPGTVSYHVNVQTSALGVASVTVPQSASSPHTISATTSTGAITVAPAGR